MRGEEMPYKLLDIFEESRLIVEYMQEEKVFYRYEATGGDIFTWWVNIVRVALWLGAEVKRGVT